MRVIIPYTMLAEGVVDAVRANGVEPELYNVTSSPDAYYELLLRVWGDGQAFTVVEHDIILRPWCIAEMEACPELWCAWVYPISTGFITGLGCVRFSEELVREHPSVVASVDGLPPDGTPRRYWGRLDTRLAQVLMDQERLLVHRHLPPLAHKNPVQPLPFYNCVQCGTAATEEQMLAGEPPYTCRRCGA